MLCSRLMLAAAGMAVETASVPTLRYGWARVNRHAARRPIVRGANCDALPMSTGKGRRLSRRRTVVTKEIGFYKETYSEMLEAANSQGLSLPLFIELLGESVRRSDGTFPVLSPQLSSLDAQEAHTTAA